MLARLVVEALAMAPAVADPEKADLSAVHNLDNSILISLKSGDKKITFALE